MENITAELSVKYKDLKSIVVALISGFLFVVSWYPVGCPIFILFAFIPLLLWENKILSKNTYQHRNYSSSHIFLYSFISFAIFNLARGWWVAMSVWFAILLPVFNATLMALVFTIYHYFRKAFSNKKKTILFFPLIWIMFENIHQSWDLNFPWFNLGNAFADMPAMVQWYEWLGASGGSLWILMVNTLLAITVISIHRNEMYLKYILISGSVLFIPIITSLIMYWNYKPNTEYPVNVVILQPNLDPYHEQYRLTADSVCSLILNMAEKEADSATDYVIAPESCLQEFGNEDELQNIPTIKRIMAFNDAYPKLNWIAGMSSYKPLHGIKTDAARKKIVKDFNGDIIDTFYYECSNIAVQIGKMTQENAITYRRKSYLTPTVEKMPFRKIFPFLESLSLDLGGTVGTLATDSKIRCFQNTNTGLTNGTLICYESVCGDLVRKFSLKGNDILFVITNDGWWGNTQGYRQHKSLSRLRAIENRRYICRSANTGVSCVIAPNGDILQQTPYWEQATLKAQVYAQKDKTFYAKHGAMVYRIVNIVFLISLFYVPLKIFFYFVQLVGLGFWTGLKSFVRWLFRLIKPRKS
ncbi:MAG: apolipoprotein N-acyltransferase [Bacteroidales bacterium]|jgi:apolipoprotein N-acyltransferase|nr:apolipoprotein N-acyltransferase [Bacteroidales bacterium]